MNATGRSLATLSFAETIARILRPGERSRAAKTVEAFGWLVLVEGAAMLFAPHWVAAVLHLPPLAEQAADYFRLLAVLVGGVGMLYVVSGRLDAEGFVFASMLDRPLVPPLMAVLWYLGIVPGPLALAFSIQDTASFLWTLGAWRAARSSSASMTR
jgi:Na+-driven multidrug efflux pump